MLCEVLSELNRDLMRLKCEGKKRKREEISNSDESSSSDDDDDSSSGSSDEEEGMEKKRKKLPNDIFYFIDMIKTPGSVSGLDYFEDFAQEGLNCTKTKQLQGAGKKEAGLFISGGTKYFFIKELRTDLLIEINQKEMPGAEYPNLETELQRLKSLPSPTPSEFKELLAKTQLMDEIQDEWKGLKLPEVIIGAIVAQLHDKNMDGECISDAFVALEYATLSKDHADVFFIYKYSGESLGAFIVSYINDHCRNPELLKQFDDFMATTPAWTIFDVKDPKWEEPRALYMKICVEFEQFVLQIFRALRAGIKFAGVYHGDLHGGNILVEPIQQILHYQDKDVRFAINSYSIHIIDFGIANVNLPDKITERFPPVVNKLLDWLDASPLHMSGWRSLRGEKFLDGPRKGEMRIWPTIKGEVSEVLHGYFKHEYNVNIFGSAVGLVEPPEYPAGLLKKYSGMFGFPARKYIWPEIPRFAFGHSRPKFRAENPMQRIKKLILYVVRGDVVEYSRRNCRFLGGPLLSLPQTTTLFTKQNVFVNNVMCEKEKNAPVICTPREDPVTSRFNLKLAVDYVSQGEVSIDNYAFGIQLFGFKKDGAVVVGIMFDATKETYNETIGLFKQTSIILNGRVNVVALDESFDKSTK